MSLLLRRAVKLFVVEAVDLFFMLIFCHVLTLFHGALFSAKVDLSRLESP